ncbi:nuclear RNA export factor 1-like [Frieseomelitta varia]|uniref:nuclear RNA export factor 1-like n=1 Tax=Frieseomelitta varia TaxID=561572 RepID=UPI001CB6845B|nr:nuclear RNA export factor 1-like [Frieseomelitta varia]
MSYMPFVTFTSTVVSEDYIINKLLNCVETLVPIKYRANENEASFFVDDKKVAVALLHREITVTRGEKLTVTVIKPRFPRSIIDDEFEKRIKQVVMKRYIPATKSMDLSRFHRDFDLISDYFCTLYCPLIVDVVFSVLSEYMPDLEALNLSGNILDIDFTLSMVKLIFVNLKILHIGDNSIRDMEEINGLQDLELEELILRGNPICKKYQFTNDYIKDVQKRCPKLLRLDGMDIQNSSRCAM